MERPGIFGPPHRGEQGRPNALTGGSAAGTARPSSTTGPAVDAAEIRFTG